MSCFCLHLFIYSFVSMIKQKLFKHQNLVVSSVAQCHLSTEFCENRLSSFVVFLTNKLTNKLNNNDNNITFWEEIMTNSNTVHFTVPCDGP